MMEPSWAAMQWIASFGPYDIGEPMRRSDLPDDQPVNNQLSSSTTTPVADKTFNLKSSECVVGTFMKVPVTQPSSVQQNNSSSQLIAANRTIHSLHN